MDFYVTISPDEWELLKPKPEVRAGNIMKIMRQYLRAVGQCGNCTGWTMKSAELVDVSKGANTVDVGVWEPLQGLVLKDDLFPHITGGLRGRVLTVASFDVSTKSKNSMLTFDLGTLPRKNMNLPYSIRMY